MRNSTILLKSIGGATAIVVTKAFVLSHYKWRNEPCSGLVEISDTTVVFTGAFFVMGLMLGGTLTDYKESERIPGETAGHLEAIQDWTLLAIRAPRSSSAPRAAEPINGTALLRNLREVAGTILHWLGSKEKDSKAIFPALRRLNESAYQLAELGADKEAVKGIQENTNALRRQLTRAYSISRTHFLVPASVLLRGMLLPVILFLLITKFKTPAAAVFVSGSLAFTFFYLYQLIIGLDDPFDRQSEHGGITTQPLDRFVERLDSHLQNPAPNQGR
ncbi:MAG: hypothetical protein RJA22_3038 [Verrucomicrobiota bacterium]|jgi:hypothetical protein